MLKLTIKKHGSFNYKNKEIKTPCTINVFDSIDDIEARLRSCGFKEVDYSYDFDEKLTYDKHSKSLINKDIQEEKLTYDKHSKSLINKDIQKEEDYLKIKIEEISNKIDNLPSIIEISIIKESLNLILDKLNDMSKNKTYTSTTYKRKKENIS